MKLYCPSVKYRIESTLDTYMEIPTSLQPVWDRFNGNMGSLWMFIQDVGNLADEKDEKATAQFYRSMADVFGADISEIESYMEELNIPGPDAEIDLTPELKLKMEAELAELRAPDTQADFTVWAKQNPIKLILFYNVVQTAKKQPPAHGKILRRSALVMMFSFFEILLSDLINTSFLLHPDALTKPEEQHISLSELREITPLAMEDVERFFIAKEVDGIMRESLRKQLSYFKEKLGITLNVNPKLRESLNEIAQRRNLIVHNDAIVDKLYLASISESYRTAVGIEKGVRLNVTRAYLTSAYETLYIFSSILIQLCWRKWLKIDSETADRALSDGIFSLLEKERHLAVKELADFAPKNKVSQLYSQLISINVAIAERELGDQVALAKTIKKIAEFPASIDTKIALSVLLKNYEKTYLHLEQAADNGEVFHHYSLDWPLFRPIKHEARLIEIFAKRDQIF